MDNCCKTNRGQMRSPRGLASDEAKMSCHHSRNIDEFPVGMAYVPWQQWKEQYDLQKGFQVGTIFPDLHKPYVGLRGARG